MVLMFTTAKKSDSLKLVMCIAGPSGSGKTRSALEIARHFGKVAVADSENGKAALYAGVGGLAFDTVNVTSPYSPSKISQAITGAAEAKYDVLVLDSFTHYWNAQGGFLDLVDQETKKAYAKGKGGSTFSDGWKALDPTYRKMCYDILHSPVHIIGTVRSKQAYEVEEENGRKKIRRVGMAPQMRDDFQYEFDVEGAMDMQHNLVIGKTRCDEIDGKIFHKPGKELAEILKAWLSS